MATQCALATQIEQRLLARNQLFESFFAREAGAWPKPAAKCPTGFCAAAACSLSVAGLTPPMRSTFRSNSSIR